MVSMVTGHDRVDPEWHDPEWIELRSPGVGKGPRTRRRRGPVMAGAVVLFVLVGANAVKSPDPEVADPRPTLPSPAVRPSGPSAGPTHPAPRRPLTGPTVLAGSGPLLAGAGRWELFARGNSDVFRIRVSTGRIERTETPPMRLTGEFSFVAGPHDVLVAPRDTGRGVLVPDGQPARPLSGLLATPGRVFPAGHGQLWYQNSSPDAAPGDDGSAPVVLTGFDGKPAGTSIPIRRGYVTSDGVANLLLKDGAGVNEIDGTAVRAVTTGSVSAVGPHHYLTLGCDAAHRCSTYLYDRSTRRQRRIGSADAGGIASGLIAPDGTHAALIHWDRAGPPHIVILDLRDGREQHLAGAPDSQLAEVQGNAVWSPDSRSLFALVDGHISIVDVSTGQTFTPDLRLPSLRQIALRVPTADQD